MRNTYSRTYNMTRKLKNVENDTQTIFDLENGRKHSKTGKMRNAHCMTWNMARKMKKIGKSETHSIGSEIYRETLKNMENENYTN